MTDDQYKKLKRFGGGCLVLMILLSITQALFWNKSIDSAEMIASAGNYIHCNNSCAIKLQECSLACNAITTIISVHVMTTFSKDNDKSCYNNPECLKDINNMVGSLSNCLSLCNQQYMTCEQNCQQSY